MSSPTEIQSLLRHAVVYEAFPAIYSPSGDLDGVRRDLPRLSELGVDVLYLMPLNPIGVEGRKGPHGSPYASRDYRAIDPALGTFDDLRRLTAEAHQLGIKVILDVVLHHTSPDAVMTRTHPSFYKRDAGGQLTRGVPEWSDIVDLDFSVPGLADELIDMLCMWRDHGLDGFRCDVAPLVPLEFWKRARQTLDARFGPTIWIGESGFLQFVKKDRDLGVPHLTPVELHEAFDVTYDADGAEHLYAFQRGECDFQKYLDVLLMQDVLYPPHAIKLRYLENHDDGRIAKRIGDVRRLMNWAAMQAFLPGATMLYAGQECGIGLPETLDETDADYKSGRRPINWAKGNPEFSAFTARLIRMAKHVKQSCQACNVTQIRNGVVQINWSKRTNDGLRLRYRVLCNLDGRCGSIDLGTQAHAATNLRSNHTSQTQRLDLAAAPWVIEFTD